MLHVPLAAFRERPIPKILWIEHIRTSRDILREADARHCQPPGAWRIGVHHDLPPFGLMRQFGERGPIDGPSVPTNAPYVLGIDLNRSESGCRCSPLALPTEPSINNTVDALIEFSRRSWPHANEESE
jgi:hypothetical protein